MNTQIQMPKPGAELETGRDDSDFRLEASPGLRRSALRVLCAVLAALTLPAGATTRIWLGATANWSNPGNWSPNGAPQNGDSLTFPVANPFIVFSMNNDLANLSLDTITFTGEGYTLNGNAITFIQGITDNHSGALNRVGCDVQFTSGGGRFNSLDVGQLEISGTTTLANNEDLIITASLTNITVSGVIQGNGGLIKRGVGRLFLRGSANNTYTGVTRVEGGDLHLAKTSAARAISSNVIIERLTAGPLSLADDLPGQYPPVISMLMTNGGTWWITNGATVTNLVMSQFTFIDGSGLLTLQCDVTVFDREVGFFFNESEISCPIYLGDQTRTFTVNERAGGVMEFHMRGQIIGPGPGIGSSGIIKTGFGDMYLDRPNIYFGPTTINQGILAITDDDALGGTGAGAETRLRGGSLECLGTLIVPERLVFESTSRIYFNGNIKLTGPLTVTNTCILYGVIFQAGTTPGRLEVNSTIDGPGGVVVQNGIVRLSGSSPNSFGGGAEVTPGFDGPFSFPTTLELAKTNNVLAIPGEVQIVRSGTNAGVLRNFQNDGVQDVRITSNGAWDLNGHGVAGRSLRFTGPGYVDTTATGVLFLGGFPGSNVLDVASGSFGLAEISGNLAFFPTTFNFDISDDSTLAIHARISSSSEIHQRARAPQTLGGTLVLDGTNDFTGAVIVEAGQLQIKSPMALGDTAAGTFVINNASLALDGGIEVDAETLTLNSTNPAALASLGTLTNVWGGNVVLQRTADIRVPNSSGALTFFGGFTQFDNSAISGPGGLTKSGLGRVFITGLIGGNTYTGLTTISEGVLEATRPGRSLSGNILVTGSNAILRTGRAGNLFNSVFTVLPTGANVMVENGGLWGMNPTNSETIGGLLGDGRVDIGSGATLTVSNGVSCTFAGVVTGSGALNKRGLATLQMTGQSPSYTGPATVFDGTYKVDGYFPVSPVTVKVSSILRGSGAVGDVTVENGGLVRVDSRNAGVLGGSMQFNSVNFQSGGVFGAQFYGPDPTGGNDNLYVLSGVTLSTPALSSGFGYPPHEGDVITLIQKISAGAVTGAFSGFPEGALGNIGEIPVVASYVGGNGNDVTLTVTNLPLGSGGSQLIGGTGSSVFVPNDCSLLWLAVTNRGSTTLSNLHGTLRSLTAGLVVTIPEATFPNLAPGARGTNATPFQIRTEPSFPCGGGGQLELVLTGSNTPPMSILYTLPGASGYHLDFDGRDDEVDVAANTFPSVVNNFTIELWANPTGNRTETAETNAGISGVSVPLHQAQRFAVFPDRGNLAYGVSHVGAGLSIGKNGISVYEQGTNHLPSRLVYSNAVSGWTHIALVYASRAPKLYVNGTLVRSGTASLFPSVHPSASLGGSTQADYGNFEGQLDEVRIWNTALSQSQIQSNMTHSLAGAEAGLVTYFRCDEGSGSVLTDSASATPNPVGALANGTTFVLSDRGPFTLPGGPDCNSGGGQCESCFVFGGTFTTNTPTLSTPLSPEGSPSLCFPPKPCPGPFPIALPPTPFIQHTFANISGTQACVTAQLHFDCPVATQSGLHAAAYLGAVDINNPCLNYLGDSGGDGTAPFSFVVPAGSNVVILVTQRVTGFGCDNYTLELFGLPCPPPTLAIERETAPQKVRVHWSTAYPGWTAEQTDALGSTFNNAPQIPAMIGGRYALTNIPATSNRFYRLKQ